MADIGTPASAPAPTPNAPGKQASDRAELPKDVPNAASQKQAQKGQAQAQGITKVKIADYEFDSENDAKSEIERGRQSVKLLNEAHKRLEASTKKEREFEARRRAAKGDFNKLIELGELSREEAIEAAGKWYYQNVVLPEQMSPAEREKQALKAELDRIKGERAQEEKETQAKVFQAKVQEQIARLRQELEPLLNEKKVPNTRNALRRVANYMKAYQEAGVEIPAAKAVELMVADYQQEFGEMLDEATPEQLEQFLGKERMQKLAKNISKWALGRLKGAPKPTENTTKDITKTGERKKMTPGEFNKFIGGI